MTAVFIRNIARHEGLAEELAQRSALGLDHLDEVWEGVLHMSPPPHGGHQLLQGRLHICFAAQAARYGLGETLQQIGLREPGTPPKGPDANFRVPDLALVPLGYPCVKPEENGWLEDGIPLVVEVRSEREELIEKLDFYAGRGVAEVLYIEWRTLEVSLFRREGKRFLGATPDRDGFFLVKPLDLRIRRVGGRLEVEDARGGGPLPQPRT